MKNDKALWGSISILVGIVIAILALVRGDMQTWLLLGAVSYTHLTLPTTSRV